MKRLLSVLIFALIFFHATIPLTFAQNTINSASTSAPLSTRLEDDVPRTYSTHTQMLILETLAAVSCQLSGIDPINPDGKCLGVDPQTQKIGFVENGGGAIAVVTSLMIFTYDIPVNTGSYVNYAFSDFGIAKSSFAQSSGFDSLDPLLPVWVAFRNVIYVLFVVAFMAVGIGIMIGKNFGAKAAMTIQNAIPKVIVVLVLVTFSFAIGGLLIDVMYLIIYLLYGVVSSIDGVNLSSLNPTQIVGGTPFGALGGIGGVGGIGELSYNASRGIGSQISAIIDGTWIGTIIGAVIGFPLLVISGPIGWMGVLGIGGVPNPLGFGNEAVGLIGGVIAFLIIIIAILSALLRLWINLLKAYLFILVDIAIAPLWIAASLIPGSPLTAGSWFRHILKYIAVFPLTFFMFLLGTAIVQLFSNIPNNSSIFAPPFVGNSLNPKHLGSLIGLAVILLVPEVINMVQSVIKAPENKLLSSAITPIKTGTAVAGLPLKKGREALFKKDGDTPIGPGAIAQKYLLRNAKQKIGASMPSGIKNKIGRGWLSKLQRQEDAEFKRYNPNQVRRGSFERERRHQELIANEVITAQNQILNRSGNTINIDIDAEITETQKRALPEDEIRAEVQNLRDNNIVGEDSYLRDLAQQNILSRQYQQIQLIQTKLNQGIPLDDTDRTLFEGLKDSVVNDPTFQRFFEIAKNDPTNSRLDEYEIRGIALKEYRKMFPILSTRYALKSVAR